MSLVIDTGPDFRQQMLREKIRKIDALLFTHHHKDHVAGLDDIRSFYFRQKSEIPVFANTQTIDRLKAEFPYVFNPGNYGGAPKINVHEIGYEIFDFGGICIQPVPVKHDSLTVLGFRIGDFTYLTDANYIDNRAASLIKGTEILVINALQKEKHPSHFTLEEALIEIKKLDPKTAYLTHMSHRMGMHKAVSKELPKNVFLAYDGLKINV